MLLRRLLLFVHRRLQRRRAAFVPVWFKVPSLPRRALPQTRLQTRYVDNLLSPRHDVSPKAQQRHERGACFCCCAQRTLPLNCGPRGLSLSRLATRLSVTYALQTIDTCDGDLRFVESEADCSAAAAAVGLADVVASSVATSAGNTDNPYGCYYQKSDKTLVFNAHGRRNLNGRDRVSLCKGDCPPPCFPPPPPGRTL